MTNHQHQHHEEHHQDLSHRENRYTVSGTTTLEEDPSPVQKPYSEEGNAPSYQKSTTIEEEQQQDEEQQQEESTRNTTNTLSTSIFFSSKAKVSPMNSSKPNHHYKNNSTQKKESKTVAVKTQSSLLSSITSSKNFDNNLQNLAKTDPFDDMEKMRTSITQKSISSSVVSYSIVSRNQQRKKRVSFSKLVAMIPLPVKLFFIVILSIISLVVFGAILVNDSAKVCFIP